MEYVKRIFSIELKPGMTNVKELFVLQQKLTAQKRKTAATTQTWCFLMLKEALGASWSSMTTA